MKIVVLTIIVLSVGLWVCCGQKENANVQEQALPAGTDKTGEAEETQMSEKITKSDAEWKRLLTPEQYEEWTQMQERHQRMRGNAGRGSHGGYFQHGMRKPACQGG